MEGQSVVTDPLYRCDDYPAAPTVFSSSGYGRDGNVSTASQAGIFCYCRDRDTISNTRGQSYGITNEISPTQPSASVSNGVSSMPT